MEEVGDIDDFEDIEEVESLPKVTEEKSDNIDITIEDVDLSDPSIEAEIKSRKDVQADSAAAELLKRYKDLGKEDPDMENIAERKISRRQLSERLESDPQFREKYISEEKEKRIKESQDIIRRLKERNYRSSSPSGDDKVSRDEDSLFIDDVYTATEPLPDEPSNGTKNGVYIKRVDKLVIKISL